jgi:hypothetical protein
VIYRRAIKPQGVWIGGKGARRSIPIGVLAMPSTGSAFSLTRFKAQRIIDAVLEGNGIETAAASIGISRSSLYEWLQMGRALRAKLEEQVGTSVELDRVVWETENQQGKKGKPVDTLAHIRAIGKREKHWLCVELVDGVEKARARAEMQSVALIRKAAEKNWQAAAWYLERRNYQEWGRKDKVEVSGPQGGPIPIAAVVAHLSQTVQTLTDEQLEGAAKIVESMAAISATPALPSS